MKISLSSLLFIIFLPSLALAAPPADIEETFKEMSEIEEPFKLKDPFQAPKLKKPEKREATTPIRNGVYDNMPQIGRPELKDIQVTGVLVGPSRRAFIKIKGRSETFTIKEGSLLGENNAVVKAILPGGLILVEKVTNIYGQTEYLETVIPISK